MGKLFKITNYLGLFLSHASNKIRIFSRKLYVLMSVTTRSVVCILQRLRLLVILMVALILLRNLFFKVLLIVLPVWGSLKEREYQLF